MRAIDVIHAKREGRELTPEQIQWIIGEYVADRTPDYQIAALLMAIFLRGMTPAETVALTEAMLYSGVTYEWSDVPGIKADKHSTGGVGDKVSLILAPLAAACGLIVPMVSGRGLGHTGGTLDKLEAIPGFNVKLTTAQARRQLHKVGCVMLGQSEQFVPADKRLYALRDVTSTVESIPLICASIMSKKMGEGCEVLVLDIKTGNGAFMSNPKDAKALGKLMCELGRRMGRKVAAILTDMNQPLGFAAGHANEVQESIDCLRGTWPADLKAVTYVLTGRMLIEAGLVRDQAGAIRQMDAAIDSGAALERFVAMVKAQGGDPKIVDNPRLLAPAPKAAQIVAPRAGYVTTFDTRGIGNALAVLGGGRQVKDDKIDHAVSLWTRARLGDKVEKGQPIFELRYRKPALWEQARPRFEAAFTIGAKPVRPPRLLGEWM